MSFGEGDLHGRVEELERENQQLRALSLELFGYLRSYADMLDYELHGNSWPSNKRGYGAKVRCGLGRFQSFPERMGDLGMKVSV